MSIFNPAVKQVHCIGIGGAGVSAIAECLLDAGYTVTGSNNTESPIVDRLITRGATIYIGHDAKHVAKADVCIYTSAVNASNPEWQACIAKNIPMLKRGEALAKIIKTKQSIGIAGTHGKTTTTSLLTWLFLDNDLNPSYAIGGEIHGLSQHATYQPTDVFVAELDESDATFLCANPNHVIITNIDHDHLVTYDHSYEALLKSFVQFINQVQPGGIAIVGGDDTQVCALAESSQTPSTTYGFSEHVAWQIMQFEQFKDHITFEIQGKDDEAVLFKAPLIGRHNAANATAAILMARSYGLSDGQIQKALLTFPGVDRRLNYQGEMVVTDGTVSVYDDYGHHPNAVVATLEAMQEAFGHERIVCVFQPHRYTRTQDCFHDFVEALRIPDAVLILPIYAASEEPIAGVTSQGLHEALAQTGQQTQFVRKEDVAQQLQRMLKPGDVVIFQGAGDLVDIAKQLVIESTVVHS